MGRKTEKKFTSSPEEIALIRPENLKLKDEFIEYLIGTDHSEKTITVYRNNLDLFFIFVQKYLKNKDLDRYTALVDKLELRR